MKTISEHLKEYFSKNESYSNGGKVLCKTIYYIFRVMNTALDDFVIFNNDGGKHFEIWTIDDLKCKDAKHFLKTIKHKTFFPYVYMYKINGKETIVRNL